MHMMVGRHYGPAGLGIFNQVLAVFLFASQIAVFGVHLSALQKVSVSALDLHTPEGHERCRIILTTSLLATAAVALPTTLLAFLMAPLVGMLFHSPAAVTGWLAILPALPLMAFNKVILNTVNGLHHMRAYALLSTSRYLLIVMFIAVGIAGDVSAEMIPVALSAAEAALLPISASYLFPRLAPTRSHVSLAAMGEHIRFGAMGLIGGTVSELNTKTDIVVLGAYSTDKIVGIYSIASLIFEGLSLVPQVLRNIINPMIARAAASSDGHVFSNTIRQARWAATALSLLGAVVIGLLFGPFVHVAFGDPSFLEAFPALIILMLGLVLTAPWAPLDMLFSQANRPLKQSLFKGGIFATNLVLNIALVPYFGMIGAAVATACAQVAGVILLKVMARRHLSFRV